MQTVLDAAKRSDDDGLTQVDQLLREFPDDARLHFLRGSLLAGLQRYLEARAAMRTAVELAPGYAVARFQLGLLELSSGDPAAAEAVWAPLQTRDAEDPLRLFTRGLGHMIRDEFEPAVTLLEQGIAANAENPPMNRDMMLVVEEMKRRLAGSEPSDADAVSAAHLLLQQYADKGTKH